MTSKKQHREYWIEIWDEQPDDDLIHHRPVANHYFEPCSKADELIHVIEYSEFCEQAQDKTDADFKTIRGQGIIRMTEEQIGFALLIFIVVTAVLVIIFRG